MKILLFYFPFLRTGRFITNSVQVLLISVFFLFSGGCDEDPSFLGRRILPSADDMKVKVDTSVVINAFTTNLNETLEYLEDLEYADFELNGYQSWTSIKADMVA